MKAKINFINHVIHIDLLFFRFYISIFKLNAKQANNSSNDYYCNSELALVIDYFKDYVILLDEIIKLKVC